MPTSFKEGKIPTDKIEDMAKSAIKINNGNKIGHFVKLGEEDIVEIFKLAL